MSQGIKRPISAYLFEVPFAVVTLYLSTRELSGVTRWIFITGCMFSVISLVYMIVKRNYFEIIDNKLVINRNIFQKYSVDLDQIEKFEIEPGPLTASKIILKDKVKIKYDNSQIDDKQLKELMRQYCISVE